MQRPGPGKLLPVIEGNVLTASVSIVVVTFGLCTIAGVDLGWIGALSGNSALEPWLSISTALGKIVGAVPPGSAVSLWQVEWQAGSFLPVW